jgi:methionyl-tRNA formyltransferase
MSTSIIACSTLWFFETQKSAEFNKHEYIYLKSKEELTLARVEEIQPRYIFFPHWSWIVPKDIVERYECVCFHSTPLPYGRGGSPIQNMIERGYKQTKVTAFRMTAGLDDGPIYFQRDVSLGGSAEEIFARIASIMQEMIPTLIDTCPEPKAQEGEPTVFKRRTPAQSELPKTSDLEKIYDHIRMLDAQGYPKAFLNYGDLRLEFDDASMGEDSVTARVTFRGPKRDQKK